MKKLLLMVALAASVAGEGQISITPQLPPVGLTLRNQLWNILISNTTGTSAWVHLELTLNDAITNAPVLSATTSVVSLAPGTQMFQTSALAPIQYTILDPAYSNLPSEDFLPAGHFLACFSVVQRRGDAIDRVAEECEYIDVQPVAPPELLFPYNQTAIETPLPVFNWLPPSPVVLFAAMTYDLNVVEMLSSQSESDAIQQNIPLYTATGLTSPFHPYPSSAPALEADKKYAWQILVKNGQSVVTQTEVWSFHWSLFQKNDSTLPSIYPFARLGKNNLQSYIVGVNFLKFDYVNETPDTVWKVRVADITAGQPKEVHLSMEDIPLKRGHNPVSIDLRAASSFINKHIYTVEIFNSRNETWSLRFEYHRDENQF